MTDPADSGSSASPERLGRTRTWWHPLFAQLVSFRLRPKYDLRPEVPLGEMPLRLDLLVIELEEGELPPEALRDLSELVPLLEKFSILELKGPTDTLERYDWE